MLRFSAVSVALAVLTAIPVAAAGEAGPAVNPIDEFKVKREAVFEFAQKPAVTRAGDQITVAFESKGLCDATVAVEDASGKIIRHLASGVLGPNAPAPFQKDTKKQAIVWDGKDDQGAYVDNKEACTVRVSLGLKPQFERTLFWCPQKRVGISNRPLMAPAPEGVYIHEGEGVDIVRLFDHDGNYVRTIYPFPSDTLKQVKGLEWKPLPQTGEPMPIKSGPKHYSTLLTSGDSMLPAPGKYGAAGSALAVQGKRMALAGFKMSRLAADGVYGDTPVPGPRTSFALKNNRGVDVWTLPRSVAFSPDGQWLYFTGFNVIPPDHQPGGFWLHAVGRVAVDAATDAEAIVFAGKADMRAEGSGPDQFHAPTSVACDAQGRVYVTDYMNDRIQVFTPDGKLFKSLKITKPAVVQIHHKTQELYVFSHFLLDRHIPNDARIKAVLTRLGPLEKPDKVAEYPLPLNGYSESPGLRWDGFHYNMALDSHTEPATIWLVPGRPGTTEQLQIMRGLGGGEEEARRAQIKLMVEKDGKLAVKRDFGADIQATVKRAKPSVHSKQRLYVNPANRKLYVWEGGPGVNKACKQLVEIDPESGKIRLVDLPFTTEDLAFGPDGMVHLRTDTHVARFDPVNWREIPWDYGEERVAPGFDGDGAKLTSTLPLPAKGRPAWFHMGGMGISPRGHLVVSCFNWERKETRAEFGIDSSLSKRLAGGGGIAYTPPLYPGRMPWGEVHVWDRHGKLLFEDAIPGLGVTDGVMIDNHDNLYALASAFRYLNGTPFPLKWTETLFKFIPKQGKVLSSTGGPVPLEKSARPARPPDVYAQWDVQDAWIEGARWFYGGVGFGSRTGGCVCWNARFDLDYFARVFAPEVDHFTVAVLDTNGNLITRVGRFGNLDEGKPLIAEGGPKEPRSIGGDEVALFHAAYVGTHTDRRLFISDGGNRRILSVKLGYHAEEKTALKDVPDAGKK